MINTCTHTHGALGPKNEYPNTAIPMKLSMYTVQMHWVSCDPANQYTVMSITYILAASGKSQAFRISASSCRPPPFSVCH